MAAERRNRRRFPLKLPIRFQTYSRLSPPVRGLGEVADMSSSGVAFRTQAEITPGVGISATINWPVTLNGNCVLKLVVEGTVLRVEAGLGVMSVARYEFRTGGRVGTPDRSEMDALRRHIGALFGQSEGGPKAAGRV